MKHLKSKFRLPEDKGWQTRTGLRITTPLGLTGLGSERYVTRAKKQENSPMVPVF